MTVRGAVAGAVRSLARTAKKMGVKHFGLLHDAGYLGMSSKHIRQLMEHKGMPNVRRSILDFVGKRELAANLFRISETEQRLKMSSAQGQRHAEEIAKSVGRKVRLMMLQEGGPAP